METRSRLGHAARYELWPVDRALATVLEHSRPLAAETIPLEAAFGRVLAEVVRAPPDLPRHAQPTAAGLAGPAGDPPAKGQVRDRTPPALLMAVREAGGEPLPLGRAHDDEALQRRLIAEGLERADVLVTSGGVSMGSRDLIKPILEQLGTIHFG